MTVLVIGATGFMGPHAVRALVRRGHDVVAFHRGETAAEDEALRRTDRFP
jgi:uncharacterized protein YbjT (DUF2867 family)